MRGLLRQANTHIALKLQMGEWKLSHKVETLKGHFTLPESASKPAKKSWDESWHKSTSGRLLWLKFIPRAHRNRNRNQNRIHQRWTTQQLHVTQHRVIAHRAAQYRGNCKHLGRSHGTMGLYCQVKTLPDAFAAFAIAAVFAFIVCFPFIASTLTAKKNY